MSHRKCEHCKINKPVGSIDWGAEPEWKSRFCCYSHAADYVRARLAVLAPQYNLTVEQLESLLEDLRDCIL